MLLQIQINFKPQLRAVFILYVTGVNTTNIFTLMWHEKQLRESYFSFVSNTCVIYTRIKSLGLHCIKLVVEWETYFKSSTRPPVGEERRINASDT